MSARTPSDPTPVHPVISDPSDLIACPQCDLLHRDRQLSDRDVARCVRCGTVLFAPRREAIALVLSLAVSALVLMGIALTFPFLSISQAGFGSTASVIDTVEAFSTAAMAPLSIATAAMILVLPITRLGLLCYVTLPLVLGRRAWPGARWSLRLNSRLRPWAMAEIFMVGVAVAMVKVADLAHLEFGPAFWAFAAVAVLVAFKDALTCERTLWRMIGSD